MQRTFTYQEITVCCKKLTLTRLDIDELYNGFCIIKETINKMVKERANSNADKKQLFMNSGMKYFG